MAAGGVVLKFGARNFNLLLIIKMIFLINCNALESE